MGTEVKKAIIPAAGLGTRFLPATKAVPKELLPIVDVPTLQYIVEEAVASGIEQVILVNGRGKGAIEDHFDISYELEDVLRKRGKKELLEQVHHIAQMVKLVSVRQKEPLGLGHAVLSGRGPVADDETFAVLLGDDIIDAETPATRQLIRVHEATGRGVVALMEVPDRETHKYGIVAGKKQADGTLRVERLVEKPDPGTAPSNLAIIGRYLLPGKVFRFIEETRPGHGGEIQLTDALQRLADEEGLVGVKVTGERHDAGDKVGWLRANLLFALKREDLKDRVRAMLEEVLEGC
ncbi:MAG: UTP--glucose-1-phosphate uridylyltransferase [Deltaproteobacteria bacterium]|nr:MAG: UTP--glucose-1-phosphate uridylyltransferase [Deltaproteobacteria bacterium]